jgi:alkylation response protein AidB-like acyl-CoA dehydrogenase
MDLAQPLPFDFQLAALPPQAERLRAEVRAFLAAEVKAIAPEERARSWSGFSPEFSKKLGQRGYIAMTWPKAHGGHERSALERYVVIEELLAAGAPVSAHWVADRQSGPLLLRFGTDEQKRVLPGIAKGETYFCIGMSEPDSGSDLASVRTRATRTNDGWRVSGTKLWTSGAHHAHYMIALFRTGDSQDQRQMGLSQFLVDLKTPGIHVRPIADLTGHKHFNEVVFDNTLLPAGAIIGAEGQGWAQVTAELAYERSGPERFLSSMMLLKHLVDAAGPDPSARVAIALGRLTARLHAMRRMSISVATQLQRGSNPALEAALVKDLGALFEQEIPELAHDLFAREPWAQSDDAMERVQAYLTQVSPSFSLRGGTREILRGIIARGLGLR